MPQYPSVSNNSPSTEVLLDYIYNVLSGGAGSSLPAGIYNEDTGHVSGDRGMLMLGVRNDTPTTASTSANGDYSQISVDRTGIAYVRGHNLFGTAQFNRPADTAAYAAKDVISNSTSAGAAIIAGNSRVDGMSSGYITGVTVKTQDVACTGVTLRIWLFNAAPSSTKNDNATFDLVLADESKLIGYVDVEMNIEGAGSTTIFGQNMEVRLPFNVPTGTDIYAIIETRSGFTPASAKQYRVDVTTDNN